MTEDYADPRLTAMGLLAEAHTGLARLFAADFDRHKTTPVEFEVLIRLARTPGNHLRMTDLAAQTTLSTSGVTRVVDRLDRDALVRREACPTDRRSSYAVLTDAGRARVDAILPGHLQLIDQWFVQQLSTEQMDQLQTALRILRDAVHPCAAANTTEVVTPAS